MFEFQICNIIKKFYELVTKMCSYKSDFQRKKYLYLGHIPWA